MKSTTEASCMIIVSSYYSPGIHYGSPFWSPSPCWCLLETWWWAGWIFRLIQHWLLLLLCLATDSGATSLSLCQKLSSDCTVTALCLSHPQEDRQSSAKFCLPLPTAPLEIGHNLSTQITQLQETQGHFHAVQNSLEAESAHPWRHVSTH